MKLYFHWEPGSRRIKPEQAPALAALQPEQAPALAGLQPEQAPALAALHCGSVFVTYVHACLRPYTVNFKCAFKSFPKIDCPCIVHLVGSQCWAGYCQGAALATVAETAQV